LVAVCARGYYNNAVIRPRGYEEPSRVLYCIT
jgi:hypothetical protein